MPNWDAIKTLPTFVPKRIRPRGQPILRIRVAGTPREIGIQRGREMAEDMNHFQEWLGYYISKVLQFPADRLDQLAARMQRNLTRTAPWMLEEIHGMSQASGVRVRELILGNFLALIGDAQGNWCTSVAVRDSDEGPLLGQNLDIGPEDFHVMEEYRPTGARAVLRHTKVTMCRGEAGINDVGLAVGSSNLPATTQSKVPWDWEGTHFHFLPTFVLRHCSSVAHAIEYLRSLPPTIPSSAGYQLNMIDPTGAMAVVDKTGDRTVVRECQKDLNYTSNCTLDEEFEKWRLGAPYTDGQARLKRIREEWAKLDGRTPTRRWLEDLMRTDAGDGCLCRWSVIGYSRLGFIFSPTKRTMDISNGPPNKTNYEHCKFTGEAKGN